MAAQIGPILFVVIVVGGLGSLGGAFVASLLIGIIQTFAVSVNASLGGLMRGMGLEATSPGPLADLQHVTVAQLAPLIPYVLMVAVLAIKPSGLFGRRET